MKIGILTYHNVPNFGAQLQAISMAGGLEKMGHEAIVLNYCPEDLEMMYSQRVRPAQMAVHNQVASRMMSLSKLCRTEEELVEEVKRLSLGGIIVGSDAVWKYIPKGKRFNMSVRRSASIIGDRQRAVILGLKHFQKQVLSVEELEANPFWGAFAQKCGIPAVALSVSCQSTPFKAMGWSERKRMRALLKGFRSITVRDSWTAEMVQKVGKFKEVGITPDPVFSFNDFCPLPLPERNALLKKYGLPDDYVLLSFRTSKLKDSYVKQLAQKLSEMGHAPVALAMPEGLRSYRLKHIIDLPLDPLEWYALIRYSAGYIGERMHPTVVCIHNGVPFYSFDEYGGKQMSKTSDLVNRCGLGGYIYSYKSKEKLPTPETVAQALAEFDFRSCSEASRKLQAEFVGALSAAVSRLSARR